MSAIAKSLPRSAAVIKTGRSRTVSVACMNGARPQSVLAANALAASLALSVGLAAPAFASVAFSIPSNGASLSSPVHVEMSVQGMELRPAADGLLPNTGHFHVIVDAPAIADGQAIVFDDAHKHYGKAQTAADLELTPGSHTLTLQFANAVHESYGPAYTSTIKVNVK